MLLNRKGMQTLFSRPFKGNFSLSRHVQLRGKKSIHPKERVVTRFAPSPTGLLHIGSLRTALYNFLLARSTNGKFILRIEDTDRTRLKSGAEQDICDILNWCNLKYDVGPIRQSDRIPIYEEYANKLLETGAAYRCFCTKDRLSTMRAHGYDRHCLHLSDNDVRRLFDAGHTRPVLRLKSPNKYDSFQDMLHGTVNIQERKDRVGFDDPILMKSDGFPTYHFANVVDDHLMEVTHVIRGDEWLPSTPKHIALYKALSWTPPNFIHIPLLTNVEDDKKLSKRKGDTSVLSFKENGIFPDALINFCALLGWSPPRAIAKLTHECFTLEELIKLFSLDHLTRGNVKVDYKKLLFFNKQSLQRKIANESTLLQLVDEIAPSIQKTFPDTVSRDKIRSILKLCGQSLTKIDEFSSHFAYFFERPKLTVEAVNNFIGPNDRVRIIEALRYLANQNFQQDVNGLVSNTSQQLDINKKLIFKTLRFALTGPVPGSKLPALIQILGPEESRSRVIAALAAFNDS
ncbi:hypothetical protein KAFR_0D01320 [Kazachstania africana CBS 2517]|uniref:Glutamate--tRNA ligase, mitochondrial n=1 Tax=Kazachstania africana (strain ATCC 22294 / BCRC 22015 / CBS 2517 / CECT 1963 / NBRC 1671 / NRRL Y-8276) TaxID=1071382 RepID=H2ATS8_KAZAF|nr:hypothetical protein KAFR_0D01320 [Kazachstania africana CBS 2517]CCF57778.1 hypothetical protein KAFR_0D01320 [Kazachstania africana CBS 2517]